MRKPRTRFAAPFVLVVGCGGQAPQPQHETVAPREDAGVEIDAQVADNRCKDIELTCIDGPECEATASPGVYEGPIRRVSGSDTGIMIEIDLQRDSHVAYWWKGVFLGGDGAPIGGSEFDVLEAGNDLAFAEIRDRCEPPSTRVRLWAPSRPPDHHPSQFVCCPNPPPPRPDAGVPPGPKRARIVAVQVQGSDQLVRIAAGTDDGVERDWSVHLLTRSGKPSPAECLIVRVDKQFTLCKYRATDLEGSTDAEMRPR